MSATITFGMGVDIPDVRKFIHFDAPNDLHSCIQETGRGGKDGKATLALLLNVNKFNYQCDKNMRQNIKNSTKCHTEIYSFRILMIIITLT